MLHHDSLFLEYKEQCLRTIKKYFGRVSMRGMARHFCVSSNTVRHWALQLGLKHEKHTVNEEFFDDLDETSAYILGYLFADGCNEYNPEKGSYGVIITTASKDKKHLENVRKILEISKPLLYAEKTNSYRMIIHNKRLSRKLFKLGMIPRKSLKVKWPSIPEEAMPHFLRGVVDGDGTVRYLDRQRSPYFEIKIFSGSLEFLEGMADAVERCANVTARPRRIGKNCHELQYSCTRGEKLGKFIYDQSTLRLERKYLPYKIHVEGKNG